MKLAGSLPTEPRNATLALLSATVNRVDLTGFIAHERARAAEAALERCGLAEALLARLPALVRGLRERGATRVVLFGSLASRNVDRHSDVDIAVAGLSPVAHLDALGWAEQTMGRRVDLVRIEEARPGLRARIEAEGEILS